MADYQWKPLTDEKKFEDLVNDLCSEKYGLEFQIYGRKGQKQYGIDGSALTKDNKHILHQCKNKMISRSDSAIQSELLKDLGTETEAMVKEFVVNKKYKVDKFIFANSFKRDTKIQNRATELSSTHSIMLIVWSWDEISDMLEEYISVARKYYPSYFESDGSIKTIYAKNNFENLVNNGTINFYGEGSSEKKETFSSEKIEDLQKELTQYLENKNEIELIKKTTLKYLPERYSEPIPETISEIINFLVAYGKSDKTLPIRCVLKELNTYYGSPLEIKSYIEYLDEVKYSDKNYECIENSLLSKIYILVEFLKKEDGLYSVTMWEYYNEKYTQDSKFEPTFVDLDNKESIKSFFDYLIDFFDISRYKDVELYLEIILPIEELSKGIQDWKYSGKRKEKKVTSKYKYVLRIQDRFRNSDTILWENKWNGLDKNNSILDITTKLLDNSVYDEELAEEDVAVLTQLQIDNINEVLYDIDEYNISIALLHLSNDVCHDEYEKLSKNKIKECRTKISSYICSNHSSVNSDLIFLLDNPNKIPNEFKNPEQNLYDW